MGSGMTEGCIWLGNGRRMGPVADNTLWRRKNRGGGCLLAVVVGGGGGGTGVGTGKNWEGAGQDYAHRRTQVGAVGNTTTARVLDECNSPSLPMPGQVSVRKAASDLAQITVPNVSHCSSVLSTQILTRKERRYGPEEMEMVAICEREMSKDF